MRDIALPTPASLQGDSNGAPILLSDRRTALLTLSQEALEGLAPEQLIDRVVAVVADTLELDFSQLWELRPDGQSLRLRAARGWNEELIEWLTIPADPALQPGFTLSAAEPVLVSDFAKEHRFAPPPYLRNQGVVSGISASIPGPGLGFGVISGHVVQPREFTEDDSRFVESLAHVLGAAITRSRFEDRVEEAERRYRSLVERLPVVSYVAEIGQAGRWLYVSPQIEQLLGYSSQDWMQDPELWASRIHPDDAARVHREDERLAQEGGVGSSEYRMVARDGSLVWVRDSAVLSERRPGSEAVVEGLLADITEAKRAEEQLRHLATHDDLTGLCNRRRFAEELERRVAGPHDAGGVLIVDLDHLKFVNDSLGHAVGDQVLKSVARAIRDCTGDDELVARLGGDEFAVLLEGVDEKRARARAGDLLDAVRSVDSSIPMAASAGVVVFGADDASPAPDLMVAADLALYEAKQLGGDRVAVFNGREGGRLTWVERVRSAIAEERLVLYAQPIVDLGTGRLHREELLVRMLDTDGSLTLPASFLPTAERFGLIREIDRWVVSQALELAASGRTVAVNLSGKSLTDRDLMGRVEKGVERGEVTPEQLGFEVTESAVATAMQGLSDFATRIERLGCPLALDDFGTGFGTFTYLKHLPVAAVKIDIQFVRDLARSEADRRIVRSIVAAAKTLGVQIVAEGVEDEETLSLLRGYGVRYAQGYHIGSPCPIGR